MDLPELDALLDDTAHLVERLVASNPDDPDLLATIEALEASIGEKAGPAHVEHIHDRFQCLLGSLGLIPSDIQGGDCG